MKKTINLSILYAILAMIGGVFFREFTKFNHFDGVTTLGKVHTHYFLLGMLFFLLLTLIIKAFDVKFKKEIIFYQIGLNITAVMMLVRRVTQVLKTELSKGANAAISGIAGIGHIILGISLIMILLNIKKTISEN